MCELAELNSPIDPVLVDEQLKKQRLSEAVGGIPYISDLTTGVPHRPSITSPKFWSL